MYRNVNSIFILSLALGACKTGSGYERLRSGHIQHPEFSIESFKNVIISVGDFTHQDQESSADSFMRGSYLPGYLGVDFESKGRFTERSRKRGVKNIYDIDNYGTMFKTYLDENGIRHDNSVSNSSAKVLAVKGKFTGTETAVRYHTYGCWPIIGTIVQIFNADQTTIINETSIEYEITNALGKTERGTISVTTEESFGMYRGFGLLVRDGAPKLVGATDKHLRDIHTYLLAAIASRL